jgi:SAM-dependent methyltransferase
LADVATDDDLLAPFERARYRRAAYYDAPDWYDVDYAGYMAELPFYRMLCSQHLTPGGCFVELGAGTGRISLRFAAEGMRVHAVEPSAAMRRSLEKKLEEQRPAGRLTLEDADAATFAGPSGEPLEVVALPFNAVLHITTQPALRASFEHVRALLRKGGRFGLDLTGPSWDALALGNLPWGRVDERVHPKTGEIILTCDKTEYRPRDRMLVSTFRFLSEDALEGEELVLEQRMWTWQEVMHTLAQSGFELEMVFGDVDFAPFSERSPRALVAARAR